MPLQVAGTYTYFDYGCGNSCCSSAKKIPIVSYMGRNTVNVYFWHYSFLVLMNKLLDMKTLVRTKEGILLLLVIGVILTFAVSLDIFNFPLKYLNKFIMNFKKRKATD